MFTYLNINLKNNKALLLFVFVGAPHGQRKSGYVEGSKPKGKLKNWKRI